MIIKRTKREKYYTKWSRVKVNLRSKSISASQTVFPSNFHSLINFSSLKSERERRRTTGEIARWSPHFFFFLRIIGNRESPIKSRAGWIRRKSTGMLNNILVTRGWLTGSPPFAYRSVNRVTRTDQPPWTSLPTWAKTFPSFPEFQLPPHEIVVIRKMSLDFFLVRRKSGDRKIRDDRRSAELRSSRGALQSS